MGTRSVVAIPEGDGWKGRYVHWDGYPTGVGKQLLRIVERDGLQRAKEVLILDNPGWSSIDANEPDYAALDQQEITRARALLADRKFDAYYALPGDIQRAVQFDDDGRFANIPGFGIAYTDTLIYGDPHLADGYQQASMDDWITLDGDSWGAEWAYVLTPAGLFVLESDGVGWRHRDVVSWGASTEALDLIEAGGALAIEAGPSA